MRVRFGTVCALALALVLVAAPVAHAMTIRASGIAADAWWENWSEDSPDYAYSGVTAGDFKELFREDAAGGPVRSVGEVVMVYSSSFEIGDPDDPSDDVYRDCFGLLEGADIAISSKLESAAVDRIVPCTVYEWVGVEPWIETPEGDVIENEPTNAYETAVAADVTWTGVGAITKSTSKSQWNDVYGEGKSKYTDTYRQAVVSGTVVDAEGNDLTFGLEAWGSLGKYRLAEMSTWLEPLP